ncbi:MAG: hypothetical protein KTR33_17070 [Gammaproteobacteria bacterium]|nr:hypothetical protein [Gammaproteobacteria bacterium]
MKLPLRSFFTLSAGLLFTGPVLADPIPAWVNSYSVDDACYCAPDLDKSLSKRIVPTPVGGKSIGQICAKVGDGPGITFSEGEFSHPVYTDAQCGNGPVASSPQAAEECEGRLAEDDIICQGVGPAWNLKQAFARKSMPVSKPSEDQQQVADVDSTNVPEATIVKTDPVPKPVVTVTPIKREEVADVSSEQSRLPLATVVETTPLNPTDSSSGSASTSETAPAAQLPLATVVETKPLASEATVQTDPIEQLPTAEIVSTRVVKTPEPGPEAATPQNTTKVVAPEPADPVPEKAAVRTTIVRAPDTPSGAVLIEQSEDEWEEEQIVAAPGTAEPVAGVPQDSQTLVKQAPASQESLDAEPAAVASAPLPAVEKPAKQDPKTATEVVAETAGPDTTESSVSSGLRIDSMFDTPGVRFRYIQLAPVGYDFGGNGASVEASVGDRQGWGLVGRASVVETYSEFMVGVAYAYQPNFSNGATVMLTLGGEAGEFDLDVTDYSDSGAFVTGMVGYDVNHRLQLQGGASYSTFFDGDPSLFGLVLLHATPALDFTGRIEIGDNDNASLGLRFNY